MTVVVGVETMKGTVILGADSNCATDSQRWTYAQDKVYKTRSYVLGFAGSWRVGQLLRYSFDPPSLTGVANLTDEGLTKVMVNTFVPTWRDVLEAGHVKPKEDWQMLVGVRGRLFVIENDFHVGREVEGYMAIGSGGQFATGSLHTTTGCGAQNRVAWALNAAAQHSPTVEGPFVTVEG